MLLCNSSWRKWTVFVLLKTAKLNFFFYIQASEWGNILLESFHALPAGKTQNLINWFSVRPQLEFGWQFPFKPKNKSRFTVLNNATVPTLWISICCQNNNGVCCLQNTNFQKHYRRIKWCTILLQWTWFFLNLACDCTSDIISEKICVWGGPFYIIFFNS